jgi:hypothetical protein
MSIPQRERGSKVMIRAKCHGPMIDDGHHERSRRAGTSVPGGDCESGQCRWV